MISRKSPRRLVLNNNLLRYNSANVEPRVYPECFEGIILSYADRYPCTMEFLNNIHAEWSKTAAYLRVAQPGNEVNL